MFTANFGNNLNCKAEYVRATDLLTVQVGLRHVHLSLAARCLHRGVQVVNCPVVRGDTRVLFQSSSSQVTTLTSLPLSKLLQTLHPQQFHRTNNKRHHVLLPQCVIIFPGAKEL